MRKFNEYKKDYNALLQAQGEKVFNVQLKGLEGTSVTIDNVENIHALIQNKDNINSEKNEFRNLCVTKDVNVKHGSYVIYDDEYYLVVTDIDNHYYYKSCKIKKCNNKVKWKDRTGVIYEFPCLLNNDSYGVKVLSDNDYIRTQNIKAQIVIQNNEVTEKIIPDMRFMFNHSEFDIYNVVDINKSITGGLITLTSEKSVLQVEDNLKENLAFSKILSSNNEEVKPPITTEYTIIGDDSFKQNETATYNINPLIDCTFYIDDFDSENIAYITSDVNGTCTIKGLKNTTDNWFTLYARDKDGNELSRKDINVVRR